MKLWTRGNSEPIKTFKYSANGAIFSKNEE